MSTVEKDVELNRLMISTVVDRLSSRTKGYQEMLKKAHEGVLEQASDAYAVLFAAFPEVDKISWTQTSGEYDDNSYSGFTMSNYGLMFVVGTEYEYDVWAPNGMRTQTGKFGFDEDGTPYEPEDLEWIDVFEIKDEQLGSLLSNIEVFQATFRDVFEDAYREGVRVVVSRDGIVTEEYYT